MCGRSFARVAYTSRRTARVGRRAREHQLAFIQTEQWERAAPRIVAVSVFQVATSEFPLSALSVSASAIISSTG